MKLEPRFPFYIPSKGRAHFAQTPRFLDQIGQPYTLVVEEQQLDEYRRFFPDEKLLVLDPAYQRNYDTCDPFGDSKPTGSGPPRNFIWDHAIAQGHDWHWIMDDNIRLFARLHKNERITIGDPTMFHAMEDFALRYTNVGMVGPGYWMFAPSRQRMPPFILNTRIYSCNLIRNDLPFRWRGRYNEDTILSLDVLKAGWCTVQFYAFLQDKLATQKYPGGNTEGYKSEGTLLKSQILVHAHPDVARVVWKFSRWHHHVDYRPFAKMGLIRKPDYEPPAENPYEGWRKIDQRLKLSGKPSTKRIPYPPEEEVQRARASARANRAEAAPRQPGPPEAA